MIDTKPAPPPGPPVTIGRCAACGVAITNKTELIKRSVRTGYKGVELGTGRRITPEEEKSTKLLCQTCGADHRPAQVMAL